MKTHRCLLLGASIAAIWLSALPAVGHNLLDPTTLAKYVDPLPNPLDNVMTPAGTLDGIPYYEVSVTQFQQKLHRDLGPTTL